jgi:hypothetical protein
MLGRADPSDASGTLSNACSPSIDNDVHERGDVSKVLALVAEGLNDCRISRITGIPRRTILDWRHGRVPGRASPLGRGRRANSATCFRCEGGPLSTQVYAYLLGLYLGDGHISRCRRTYRIRFTLDAACPGIVAECIHALESLVTGKTAWCGQRSGSRCVDIAMYWNHWPCLFPQHGPGRKHERQIRLAAWQQTIIEKHRKALLRGLIHSDGCRVVANDRGVRSVRYHFSNASEDIKRIYCSALEGLGIPWTRPSSRQIAVYRQDAVRRLDEFVGGKR